MKQEDIKLIVSVILIVFAFGSGYLFASRQYNLELQREFTPIYIDITTAKSNITIKNTPPHVFFRINGDILQNGQVELKK